MNNKTIFTTNLILALFVCYVSTTLCVIDDKNLRVGFYNKSCPDAERIVQGVVAKAVLKDPSIGPSLIRLFFHDCFVQGCDASILLDKSPSGKKIEKTSPANVGVRGFEVIDEAKTALEKACLNTVSCADIMSFVARDAATLASLAPFDVPAGRRDGLESIEENTLDLPFPNLNVEAMEERFNKKGMNKSDIVTLLGAHSLGAAHCQAFESQFRNFNATQDFNPKLSFLYATVLGAICPDPASKDDLFPLNVFNEDGKLSTQFYNNVVGGRVVIPADQSLLDDGFTNDMVRGYVNNEVTWRSDFRNAMVKLGKVDVLTGDRGEIRKMCRSVN